jgi:cell division septal protein FtsQ
MRHIKEKREERFIFIPLMTLVIVLMIVGCAVLSKPPTIEKVKISGAQRLF